MAPDLDASATRPSPATPLLEVRDLRVGFDTRRGMVQAVDGVSFSLDRAKSLGVLGESGCGKSVMARSIMRLVGGRSIVSSGQMLYATEDGKRLDLMQLDRKGEDVRRLRGGQIAMIFQEPMSSLNPVYTVANQILESLRLHRTRNPKLATELMLDALAQVGLPDPKAVARSYPHQLSGGMRQRVMIAMALACEPELLIADEPTTALDVTTAAQIIELLMDIQAKRNMAIMFITHDMGILANLAQEVIVMYLGQIVERGTARQVFKSPQHPYTQGLLASVPQIGMERRALTPIQGSVQEPIDLPQECRFRARCPHAFDKCATLPPLFEIEPQHESRCWLGRA
jgi:peptide/nickel transport system ATP-binding protein